MRKRLLSVVVAALFAVTPVFWWAPTAQAALPSEYEFVTSTPDWWGGDNLNVSSMGMSRDGRYVAYGADSAIFSPNHTRFVFLYDRQTRTTKLVSHGGSDTIKAGGNSSFGGISGDGRYVIFLNWTSYTSPVSVYQYSVETTELTLLMSFDPLGSFGGVSDDGQRIIYGDADGDVHLYDVSTGQDRQLTTDANQLSGVQFQTYYADLTLSDTGTKALFRRITEKSQGEAAAFDLFLYDLTSDAMTQIQPGQNSYNFGASITADGRYVLYSHSGTEPTGSMLYDTQTQQTSQITNPGTNWPTLISPNGRFIAYSTQDSVNYQYQSITLVDRTSGEVRTLCTGTTDNCNLGGRDAISDNGNVAFSYWEWPTGSPSKGYVYGTTVFDAAPPILGQPVFSLNPKPTTGSSTVSIPVTDDASAISRGEYFIGDTDPGQGNAAAMTLADVQNNGKTATLNTTFGTDFAPGVYKISFRAQDAAGNWSAIASDYLTVYDPTGPTDLAASKRDTPSLANGDKLPGLTSDTQKDKAILGFDVYYTSSGAIDPRSQLSLLYEVGKCNGPNPVNCQSTQFTVNSTVPNSINLFSLSGDNNANGMFLGQGTLTINGAVTTNPFKVVAVDGDRLTPRGADDATLYIYAPGTDPHTATPSDALYQLRFSNTSWVTIK